MANQPSFIKDFIELYQKHKCLWKIKDSSYANKALRAKAYQELLELYKTVDSEATVESVKNKINNMRSAFRKELKKVKMSKRSGSSADEIYTPSLWYYDLLLFTTDQEECRETLSSCVDIQDESEKTGGDNEENELESELSSTEASNPFSPTTISETTCLSRTPTPTRKKAKQTKHDLMVEKAYEVLSRGDNEFKTVGANVAWKLQRMEKNQRDIAEHLINTILHYGITNKLSDNVTINLYPSNRFTNNAAYNMYSQDSSHLQAQHSQSQLYPDITFVTPPTQSQIQSCTQSSRPQHYTQQLGSAYQPKIPVQTTSYLQSFTPITQIDSCNRPQLCYEPQSPDQSQPQHYTNYNSHSQTQPRASSQIESQSQLT
ncbi:uncharacterized protein LOC116158689 [Photinus pyralis]|uniref:uncharacterized protein LOC116158689 n=1 Tax=Photinus pyralis TaxID=7054 RepID=UPI0012673ED6|nr:uncharacterized protein LOC116158689 [Photinus pyralis]